MAWAVHRRNAWIGPGLGPNRLGCPAVLRCSACLTHIRRPPRSARQARALRVRVGRAGSMGETWGTPRRLGYGHLAGTQMDGQRGRCKHPGGRREATDSDPARHWSCGLPTTGGPGVRSSRPRPERPTRVLRALPNPRRPGRAPTTARNARSLPDPRTVVMPLQWSARPRRDRRRLPISTLSVSVPPPAEPSQFEYPRVGALVTGRLHPDPADARSPLLRAFRLSGGRSPHGSQPLPHGRSSPRGPSRRPRRTRRRRSANRRPASVLLASVGARDALRSSGPASPSRHGGRTA